MDKGMRENVQLFVTGELDENEHKKVLDWISSSRENRRYYNALRLKNQVHLKTRGAIPCNSQ